MYARWINVTEPGRTMINCRENDGEIVRCESGLSVEGNTIWRPSGDSPGEAYPREHRGRVVPIVVFSVVTTPPPAYWVTETRSVHANPASDRRGTDSAQSRRTNSSSAYQTPTTAARRTESPKIFCPRKENRRCHIGRSNISPHASSKDVCRVPFRSVTIGPAPYVFAGRPRSKMSWRFWHSKYVTWCIHTVRKIIVYAVFVEDATTTPPRLVMLSLLPFYYSPPYYAVGSTSRCKVLVLFLFAKNIFTVVPSASREASRVFFRPVLMSYARGHPRLQTYRIS